MSQLREDSNRIEVVITETFPPCHGRMGSSMKRVCDVLSCGEVAGRTKGQIMSFVTSAPFCSLGLQSSGKGSDSMGISGI
jgi:hypothetical protein